VTVIRAQEGAFILNGFWLGACDSHRFFHGFRSLNSIWWMLLPLLQPTGEFLLAFEPSHGIQDIGISIIP
jgi:hypothetical protein